MNHTGWVKELEWIVLGRYGPYPAPGGATSGYLLCHQDIRLLIDCGGGVLSRMMAQRVSPGRLNGVLLSHLHYDHISDMGLLRYALEDLQRRGYRQPPLKLWLPASPQIAAAPWDSPVFETLTIEEGTTVDIEGLHIQFQKMTHPVESYAMRFDAGDESMVYSGDTGLNDDLAQFCMGCQLLVCDTKFYHAEYQPGAAHLTAIQAAQVARQAQVDRLLLTHLPPDDELDPLQAEAARIFPGARLAREGHSYTIQRRKIKRDLRGLWKKKQ